MAKTTTKIAKRRTVAKTAVGLMTATVIEQAELKSFGKGDAAHPGFSFTRYWWEGAGPRAGIAPWVHKKLNPGDDPTFGKAAKAEMLLPDGAPADYADLAFMLERFDRQQPSYERHVMIQVKLALPEDEPWHVGYERGRAFARSHFCGRGFPVILVAHVPSVVGLEGRGSHVHCIVLARPLSINGFGGPSHRLCSDKGYAEALAAWNGWVGCGEGPS